jgi:hypothetical protein
MHGAQCSNLPRRPSKRSAANHFFILLTVVSIIKLPTDPTNKVLTMPAATAGKTSTLLAWHGFRFRECKGTHMKNTEQDVLLNRLAQQDLECMKARYDAAAKKSKIVLACMIDDRYTTSGRDKIIADHPIDSTTLGLILVGAASLERSQRARLLAHSKNADMREYVDAFYRAESAGYKSKDQFASDMVDKQLPIKFAGRKIPTKMTVRSWLPKDGPIKK